MLGIKLDKPRQNDDLAFDRMKPLKSSRRSRVFDSDKLRDMERDLQRSQNSPAKEPKDENSLVRVNGCGVALIGKWDVRLDETYATTAWFTLLWIPVIPLRSFRVWSSRSGGFLFYTTSFLVYEKQ